MVLDLVLQLQLDLTCHSAPLRLSGALTFLLLLFLHSSELFKSFGIEIFLLCCLLLAKELLPEPGMGFRLGSLQGYLLFNMFFVETLPQFCFFLFVGLLKPKLKLS